MDNTKFQINVLPAGVGDCLHLRFFSQDKWYNIVIDSGPSECAEQFRLLLKGIKKGEQVDLLCFTHIDDDHIKAAELVFGSNKWVGDVVKEIWINIPECEKKVTKPLEPERLELHSVDSAIKLYRYIRWFEENTSIICQTQVLTGENRTFGATEVTAVLPYLKRLNKLEEWWVKKRPYLGGLQKNSSKSSKSSDRSVTNGSSIVLLIDHCNRKLLFTGDAFAVDLFEMASQKKIPFDLVKLPHHGSRANITKRMLEALGCCRFIISANGGERPDQETVGFLGRYGAKHGKVRLYGNYQWKNIKDERNVEILRLRETADKPMDPIELRTEGKL